jgi:hypothetical protein
MLEREKRLHRVFLAGHGLYPLSCVAALVISNDQR